MKAFLERRLNRGIGFAIITIPPLYKALFKINKKSTCEPSEGLKGFCRNEVFAFQAPF
jgi:hypothetical protein